MTQRATRCRSQSIPRRPRRTAPTGSSSHDERAGSRCRLAVLSASHAREQKLTPDSSEDYILDLLDLSPKTQ